jgi:hypothetical protein
MPLAGYGPAWGGRALDGVGGDLLVEGHQAPGRVDEVTPSRADVACWYDSHLLGCLLCGCFRGRAYQRDESDKSDGMVKKLPALPPGVCCT